MFPQKLKTMLKIKQLTQQFLSLPNHPYEVVKTWKILENARDMADFEEFM